MAAAASAARKSGENDAAYAALQLSDEPCAVALSASGFIARTDLETFERWKSHSENVLTLLAQQCLKQQLEQATLLLLPLDA